MAQIIDGKQVSLALKQELREEVILLSESYGRKPCLMVIIVGENPASQSYVRGKIKAAEMVGMAGQVIELPETVSEQVLLDEIARLNADETVDGVLVQLPLPKHISEEHVIAAISAAKDVDGFHPENVAKLWLGEKCVLPCTPKGIMRLIDETGIEPAGKLAVVIGRSNIVGKPVSKLLLDRNATVVMAHSRTHNLKELTRQADIVVVAIGRPLYLTADYLKPGAVVIDVGINRLADGRLVGDVDFEGCEKVAGWITPVPGGVGPMTIAELMSNTVELYRQHVSI